jgi:hypothetical protein
MTPEEAAKDPKDTVPLVFRGKVSAVEKLPEHPKMRGRERYAVTFAVESYVKGGRGRKITLHELQDGTDCMGMNYIKGRRYLVFALEEKASDVILDGKYFWYGWSDVLPPGAKVLRTAPCTPGGELGRK